MVQLIGDHKAFLVWESRTTKVASLKWAHDKIRNVTAIDILQDDEETMAHLFREFVDFDQAGMIKFAIKPANGKERSFNVVIPPVQEKKTTRIVVVGDNQSGVSKFQRILNAVKSEAPDIFLHVGDMVQWPRRHDEWQTFFFDPLGINGICPFVPFLITQGNHDIVFGHSAEYFPNPTMMHKSPTGNYYALSVGNARIMVMDTNIDDEEQIKWLEGELKSEKSTTATFRIVSVHVAPFIEYWDPFVWNERGEKHSAGLCTTASCPTLSKVQS